MPRQTTVNDHFIQVCLTKATPMTYGYYRSKYITHKHTKRLHPDNTRGYTILTRDSKPVWMDESAYKDWKYNPDLLPLPTLLYTKIRRIQVHSPNLIRNTLIAGLD